MEDAMGKKKSRPYNIEVIGQVIEPESEAERQAVWGHFYRVLHEEAEKIRNKVSEQEAKKAVEATQATQPPSESELTAPAST